MARTAQEMAAGTKVQSFDFSEPSIPNHPSPPKMQIRSYRVIPNALIGRQSMTEDQKSALAQKDILDRIGEIGKELANDAKDFIQSTRQHSTTVTLPMPGELQFDSQFDWGAQSQSLFGSYIGNAANGESISQMTDNPTGSISTVVTRAASNLPGGDIFLRNAGLYSDAMKEMLFNGHNHRQFSWSWEIIPRNAKQAEDLMKMLRKLNIDAHPEKFARGLNILPCEFEVSFIGAKLPMVGKLVCTNVGRDFAAGLPGSRFTKDGYAASVSFKMTFLELELQDRLKLEGDIY